MLLVHCKKKSPKMKKKVREEEGGVVGALQVPELFTASETSPLILPGLMQIRADNE